MKPKTVFIYVFLLMFIGTAILIYQSASSEGDIAVATDCVQITEGPVSGLSGFLILESRRDDQASFVLNLATGERRELPGVTANSIVGPSKAGWLTYDDYLNETWVLVDLNAQGEGVLDVRESTMPIAWLGDGQLLVGGDRLQVLDLASGEKKNVVSDSAFAQIHKRINWSSQLNWGGYSQYRLVPGTDSRYLAYAANGEPGELLVLMDQETGQEVARLHWADTLTPPQWAPDGRSLVTSAPAFVIYEGNAFLNSDDDLPYVGGNELILVGVDGSVKRLTTFTSRLKALESQYQWSPDSKHIAFGLELQRGDAKLHRAVILDMASGQVTTLCFPPHTNHLVGFPVWSPDGRKIAFTLSGDDRSPQVYIVDLEGANATKIDVNVQVAGWWAK